MKRLIKLLLWPGLCLALASGSRSADYYWTNNGALGDFTNAACWVTNDTTSTTVPAENDSAFFTNAANYSVNWSCGATNANAYFNATSGTATLNIGAGNTWMLTNSFVVGQYASASCAVKQTGGDLSIANAARTATLFVGGEGKGAFTLTNGTLFVNRLLATNNALAAPTNSTFNFYGGTLTTSNAADQIAADIVVHSNQSFSSAGNYDIKGNWNMRGGTNLINMLYVNPGVVKGYIYFGGSASGASGTNTITVATGAVWHVIAGNPYLSAANNTIQLLDGGRAIFPTIAIGGTSNSIQVAGPGSLFTVQSNGLSFGGSRASLVVSNGGVVYASGGGSIDNMSTLTVTGPGSLLTNSGSIMIGRMSSSNNMVIADGGTIVVPNMPVGGGGGQTYYGNTLTVTGPGSSLTNLTGSLYLGDTGTEDGSLVIVSNGGRIVNATLGTSIGQGSVTNRNNSMVVTGSGSVLSNKTTVVIAQWGKSNSMTVADGGQVFATTCTIANNAPASNNVITVSGAGSLAQFSGALTLGNAAGCCFNSAIVTNGGTLSSVGGNVGNKSSANSNDVTVTGAGSTWTLGNGVLAVGNGGGTGNVLMITQSGTVDNVGTLTVVTNSVLSLLGGTLEVANMTYSNSGVFTVGDGTQSATLKSIAGGTLKFTNGLVVNTNATLLCLGTVDGLGYGIAVSSNAYLLGSGIVKDETIGVIVTNGATFSPGANGAGTLTIGGSNLTWNSGGIYRCEITDLFRGPGSGWDLINVSSQLNLANGPGFVIELDSVTGAPASNFNPYADYGLLILNYGSMNGYDSAHFAINTNSFRGGATNWCLTNFNNSLYLQYRGSGLLLANDYKWNDPNSGLWSLNANWTNGSAPAAGGDGSYRLEFGGSGTAYAATNDQTNAAGQFFLNKLLLTGTGGPAVTNVIAGGTLVFTNAGARIDFSQTECYLITNAITLGADTVFGGLGAGTVIISSNIAGGKALTKEGPWTLALQGSNTFADPVVVQGGANGIISMENARAFDTNSFVVTNGGKLYTKVALGLGNGTARRSAIVTGNSSLWTNQARLTIGSNATVTVSDGARLVLGDGFVMNSDSVVPCGLLITNGGQVAYSNTASMYILVGNSTSSNTMIVTGNGSMFSGPGDGPPGGNNWMYIGPFGGAMTGNSLRIENGGVFTNARLYVSGTNAGLIVASGGKCYPTALNVFGGCVSVVGGAGVTSSISGGCNLAGRGATGTVDGAGVDGSASITAVMSLNGGETAMNVIKGGRVISLGGGGTYAVGQVSASNELVVAHGGFARFGGGPGYGGLGFGNGAVRNSMIVRDSGSILEVNANGGYPWYIGFGANLPSTNYANVIYAQNGGTLTNNAIINIASGLVNIPVSSNCFNCGILVSATGLFYSSGAVNIGLAGCSSGNFVKVIGAGSLWNAGGQTISIGHTNGLSTNNYLTVDQGGAIENVGLLVVRSNNQVNLLGGTLGITNAAVTNGLVFIVGDGVQTSAFLKALGGTLKFNSGLTVNTNAALQGLGTILSPTTTVYGALRPGLTIGAITNNGELTFTTGSSSIFEIGAYTAPGSGWDYLFVTNGTLALNGILRVQLNGGFMPTNTENYLIMTNTQPLSGAFENAGDGQAVTVYTNGLGNSAIGTFRVTIAPQAVILDNFQLVLPGGKGTVWNYY